MNPWLARRSVTFKFVVTTGYVVNKFYPAIGSVKHFSKDKNGFVLNGIEGRDVFDKAVSKIAAPRSLYKWFYDESKASVKTMWSATLQIWVGSNHQEAWAFFFEVDTLDIATGECKLNVTPGMMTVIRSKFIK